MNNLMAHILVVDDDDGIRSLVKKYLKKFLRFKKRGFIMLCLNQAQKRLLTLIVY